MPLARYAPSISSYAQERGLASLRVFGSVARGHRGFESDIDLIGTPTRDLSLFELADIASFTSELTGFPTEVTRIRTYPKRYEQPLTRPWRYE